MREDDIIRLRAVVMRLSRDLRKASTEEGLTTTQSAVLARIVRNDEMPLSELAGVEGLNPTMLSRVIGHLEESALITRSADSNDRRITRAKATALGKKTIQRLRHKRTIELTKRVETLNPEEVESLIAALPALEHMALITEMTSL